MNREEKLYLIRQASRVSEIGEISDGFHTFNSLYNQRLYLWAALVKAYKDKAWKSKKHSDGKPCFDGGWFIVGITTPAGDYTYHYKLEYWGLFDCKVLDKAPAFDGHTDKDITRVMTLKSCCTSQWIPVEERLPKEKQKVLVYMPADERCDHEYMCEALYNYAWHKWEDADEPIELEGVTHWLPLPTPPAPRKEE